MPEVTMTFYAQPIQFLHGTPPLDILSLRPVMTNCMVSLLKN